MKLKEIKLKPIETIREKNLSIAVWKNGDFTSFTVAKGFCDKLGNWNNEHIAFSHFELVRFNRLITEVLEKHKIKESNKNEPSNKI